MKIEIKKADALRSLSKEFKAIFAAAPPAIILAPDAPRFTIIYGNDAFYQTSGRKPEEVVGLGVFEVFPENPQDKETGNVSAFQTSLMECLSTKKETHLPGQKYDIPVSGTDAFETRYWQASNNPILDTESGEVDYIIHLTIDITGAYELAKQERIALEVAEAQRLELQSLFMEAPAGIVVYDGPDFVYQLVNPVYQSFFPGRELHGKPILDAQPELIGHPVIESMRHTYLTGETFFGKEVKTQFVRVVGGPLVDSYWNFIFQARFNESKEIDGILMFGFEVTDQVEARQKVEASERHFRYLADLVPAKISNALPTGEVTFFNKRWLDFSGLSFENLRDYGYHDMMHPDELEEFQKGLTEAAKSGVPYESEMRFLDRNGIYKWHLNIASPILDENGQIIMWVGCTTEIQKLKDEEQRKSDFIGMVSHELKTPLTTLTACLQFLANKFRDEREANMIKQAVKQSGKMKTMINGFLNVSRLESGQIQMNKQELNIVELLREIAEEAAILYSSHNVIFMPCDPITVNVDQEKVGHVLNNLISNASKYSAQGSTVRVNCRVQDNYVVFSVADQGVGIKKEDIPHLFDRYFRVENESTVSGFGIGLYLSAELIKRHGGKIWVESEIGRGSIFYCSLPCC